MINQLSLCKIHFWSKHNSRTTLSVTMGITFLFMHHRKWLRKRGATICGGTIRSSSTRSTGCLSRRWCVPSATRSLWPLTPSATWVSPYLWVRRESWRCSTYHWIPQPNPLRFVSCYKKTARYQNAQSFFGRKKRHMCSTTDILIMSEPMLWVWQMWMM